MSPKIKIAIAVFVVMVGVVMLSIRGGSKTAGDGPVAIRNGDEYEEARKEALELTKEAMPKLDTGEELNNKDKENLAKAVRLYDGMSQFTPAKPWPDLAAGQACLALGKREDAIRHFDQYLNAFTDGADKDDQRVQVSIADTHWLLSNADYGNHQYQQAYDEANKALTMYPDTVNYRIARASALTQLGRNSDALKDVNLVLKADPENSRARGLKMLLNDSKKS